MKSEMKMVYIGESLGWQACVRWWEDVSARVELGAEECACASHLGVESAPDGGQCAHEVEDKSFRTASH